MKKKLHKIKLYKKLYRNNTYKKLHKKLYKNRMRTIKNYIKDFMYKNT